MEGNISSPIRYSYLSILPDDNAHIFAVSLLIFYCSFPSLIISPIVKIFFHTLSKKLHLKGEGLFDARVVSLIKKEYGSAVQFFEDS